MNDKGWIAKLLSSLSVKLRQALASLLATAVAKAIVAWLKRVGVCCWDCIKDGKESKSWS